MNTAALIADIERQGIRLMLNERGGLRVRAPKMALSDALVIRIRENKQDLIDALRARHEARMERAAILEYDHGHTREQADEEAAIRIQFVSCHRCRHWESNSPCGAGMYTSGIHNGAEVRICGFYQGIES